MKLAVWDHMIQEHIIKVVDFWIFVIINCVIYFKLVWFSISGGILGRVSEYDILESKLQSEFPLIKREVKIYFSPYTQSVSHVYFLFLWNTYCNEYFQANIVGNVTGRENAWYFTICMAIKPFHKILVWHVKIT